MGFFVKTIISSSQGDKVKKYFQGRKNSIFSIWVILAFLNMTMPNVYASGGLEGFPVPGTMVFASPPFTPVVIRGIKIHPNNPLLFDFILDSGESGLNVNSRHFKDQAQDLIKYFLTALTVKDQDLWVNLSPYEKDRIIPEGLGTTLLGQDMLAEDYILKQLSASLVYPENQLGKEFWSKVYSKAQELFNSTDIPVSTFNKVWLVADRAKVFVHDNSGYVVGAHLKVMLQEDYVALIKQTAIGHPNKDKPNEIHLMTSEIVRRIILPQIEKEVNEGKNFAKLRQIFYAMILSTWYKMTLKNALLNQVYSNKAKTGGVLSVDMTRGEKIYRQYLQAYKKGVFNYIKEMPDATSHQMVARKYFSGGVAANFAMKVEQTAKPTGGVLSMFKGLRGAMVTVLLFATVANPAFAASKKTASGILKPILNASTSNHFVLNISMRGRNVIDFKENFRATPYVEYIINVRDKKITQIDSNGSQNYVMGKDDEAKEALDDAVNQLEDLSANKYPQKWPYIKVIETLRKKPAPNTLGPTVDLYGQDSTTQEADDQTIPDGPLTLRMLKPLEVKIDGKTYYVNLDYEFGGEKIHGAGVMLGIKEDNWSSFMSFSSSLITIQIKHPPNPFSDEQQYPIPSPAWQDVGNRMSYILNLMEKHAPKRKARKIGEYIKVFNAAKNPIIISSKPNEKNIFIGGLEGDFYNINISSPQYEGKLQANEFFDLADIQRCIKEIAENSSQQAPAILSIQQGLDWLDKDTGIYTGSLKKLKNDNGSYTDSQVEGLVARIQETYGGKPMETLTEKELDKLKDTPDGMALKRLTISDNHDTKQKAGTSYNISGDGNVEVMEIVVGGREQVPFIRRQGTLTKLLPEIQPYLQEAMDRADPSDVKRLKAMIDALKKKATSATTVPVPSAPSGSSINAPSNHAPDKGMAATPGGIDLNAQNMGLEVSGDKIRTTPDWAMIADFEKGNFSGVKGTILKIVPISGLSLS